jgi:hypothetical protein
MSTAVSRSASRPLAILLSFVLAIAGLLVVPSPASAAPGDVTGGSASWGVDAAWRAMFSSPTMRSATGGASIASGDMPTWPVTTGSSWDAASGSGTVQLAGAVRLGYLTGAPIPGSTSGNYVYLNNPTISISGSTGTISAQSAGSSHELNPELPMAGLATRTIATLDLSGMTPTEVDGTLTWTAVPVAIAAGGTEILASYASADDLSATKRAVGSALDPITFSITREAPLTATTTSLTVSPVGGAVAGDDVTLTAEVAPSIDGTVQFRSGPDALGAPVTVVAGVASLTVDTLATATHSLAAVFTPADAGYAGSASAAVDFPVVATAPTRGAAWGLSTYLNSANFGRPNPSPANFVAPAGFDPATRVSTWGSPTVVSNADGTVTLNFSGATLNHAGTGGNWLRLADLSATLDAQGNGVVSAVVSYGTVPGTPPSIPYDASTAVTVRGPERVDLVTLSGNAVSPVAAPGGSTWSGLTGLWDADFLAFLAGGDGAAAWGYASTVTNTGAADRKPAPLTFTLPSVPTFAQYATDAAWGLSTYLNSANFGRPNPSAANYGAPTTFDASTRVTTFTSGVMVANPNRTITVSYPGSSLNHAGTGGNWLRLADLQVTVDESGDGVVSALVSYGTVPGTPPSIPFNASTAVTVRGPERVDVVTLTGNDAELISVPAGATLAGLQGQWDDDFLAFLAGSSTSTPTIGAWGYASTVTNTGAADRKPSPLTLRFATAPVFTGTPDGEEPPTEPGTDPGTPAVTPAPGTLTWGVKTTFREYILGTTARGTITTSGGAGAIGAGYWFPQSGVSLSTDGLGSVAYRGGLSFSGHNGLLSLRVADPVVRLTSSSSGTLSVVTTSGRVDFATLNLAAGSRTVASDGSVSYTSVPATLTAVGAAGFAGFYGAGETLDPVSFTIGSNNASSGAASSRGAASAVANTPDATAPATEGVTSEQSTFTAGATATFTAEGYQPNEAGILAVIYSEPTLLADDLVADASGVVTWTGALPAGLTGEHTFTFQGSVDRGIVIDIAAAETVGCQVESATLSWGFKESFRAYIDGSIANGEWTVADGATYETPLFGWTGTGGYDADTGDADLAFAGSVRFTGHGGVLDTTIANPRVVIDGDRAVILLDITGTTQDGTAVSSLGVEFADLDLASAEQTGGGDLVAFTGIPAVLTEAGAAAFGTYEAGSDLDPVDLAITVDPTCAEPAAAVDEPGATTDAEVASDTSSIVWIVLAILAVLAAAVAVLLLVRRARKV